MQQQWRALFSIRVCTPLLLQLLTFSGMVSFAYYLAFRYSSLQPAMRLHGCEGTEAQETQRLIEVGRATEAARASKGMWTIEPIGRLGNMMGEYSTLYALAKLNGHQAYVLPTMYNPLSKLFRLTLPMLDYEVADRSPWKHYDLHDWMSDEYKSIQGDYIKLQGYPCSWTFYHHIQEEIRREFSFHDFVICEVNTYLSSIRGNRRNVTFVGVHVRRGDYIQIMPNIWKGVVADRVYLQKAMDYFRGKYANPLFVVTSNGMDWCRENINTSMGDVYFAGDGHEGSPQHDFAILAHCNHTIMTIGTFGYWAGYLVGGETVYLSNFTLPDSEFLQVFKYEAAYLPGWVGIPADLSPLLKQAEGN